jgi:hypothetical protein
MSLMDAPVYDPAPDRRKRYLIIGSLVALFMFALLTVGGYTMGHGWLFTNLNAEHHVNNFFKALEAKDYNKAYGIYNNDADWQQHPGKYSDYPLPRFTEDWTTESPVKAPIVSHHVDVSAADGSGLLGSTVIVAVRVNGDHKIFLNYMRSDGTLTCCSATHIIQY